MIVVQGSDPSLRDREVQRAIDELLGPIDRSLALDDHTVESRRRGASADTEPADDEPPASGSLELPAFTAIVNALQSPPFMTECRVVVVREIDDRRDESLAAVAYGVAGGCRIVRVHDVLGSVRVCRTMEALLEAGAREAVAS